MSEQWRLIKDIQQVGHVAYVYELLKDKTLKEIIKIINENLQITKDKI